MLAHISISNKWLDRGLKKAKQRYALTIHRSQGSQSQDMISWKSVEVQNLIISCKYSVVLCVQ